MEKEKSSSTHVKKQLMLIVTRVQIPMNVWFSLKNCVSSTEQAEQDVSLAFCLFKHLLKVLKVWFEH